MRSRKLDTGYVNKTTLMRRKINIIQIRFNEAALMCIKRRISISFLQYALKTGQSDLIGLF